MQCMGNPDQNDASKWPKSVLPRNSLNQACRAERTSRRILAAWMTARQSRVAKGRGSVGPAVLALLQASLWVVAPT